MNWNSNIEKKILGMMVNDSEALHTCLLKLEVSDFYEKNNKLIFKCIYELAQAKKKIDLEIIIDTIKNDETLIFPDFEKYITEDIVSTFINTESLNEYIETVKNYAIKNKLDAACEEFTNASITIDFNEQINSFFEKLKKISDNKSSEYSIHQKDMLEEVYAAHKSSILSYKKFNVKFGYSEIDKHIKVRDGGIYILAARPGVGKTDFAMNFLYHASRECLYLNDIKNYPKPNCVMFFSFEMTNEQLADRFHSIVAKKEVYLENMTEDEDLNSSPIHQDLKELPIKYIFKTLTTTEIASTIKEEQKKHEVKLVVIDYLGIISKANIQQKHAIHEQEAIMVTSLKEIAKQYKVPIFCLAQLNRESDNYKKSEDGTTSGSKLSLNNIKGSSAIEAIADVVCFLDNPSNDTNAKIIISFIIKKNRTGGINQTIQLAYDKPIHTFFSINTNEKKV